MAAVAVGVSDVQDVGMVAVRRLVDVRPCHRGCSALGTAEVDVGPGTEIGVRAAWGS